MSKPPFIQRAAMAIDLLRGTAFNGPAPSADRALIDRISQQKALPFAWPAWREGVPQWHLLDFQSYINEGFNLNALIYSSIMWKCRAITQAPLRAYSGDIDNPTPLPEKHPHQMLARRPNPHQSHIEYQQQCLVYLNLAGEFFTLLMRPKPGALPTAMYSLRPDRVYIVPGDGAIMGYIYVPEGKALEDGMPILPQDMIHVKLPNPGDTLEGMGHGLSPLSPLAQSADVDNMITAFLKQFFEQSAIPPGVLKFQVELDPDIAAQIKARWMEMYGGFRNWTEIGVLDRGAEYQRVGMTFEEMSFTGLDDRNEARILAPFGVPPILIGSRMGLERSTFSNYREARAACWEDTLIPELMLSEVEYFFSLRDERGGTFMQYDLSQVPALQKDVPALAQAAKTLFDMGTPRDIAYQTVGLTVEQSDFGDVSFLPSGYTTADLVVNPPAPPPKITVLPPGAGGPEDEDDPEPETDPGKLLPDGKGAGKLRMPPFMGILEKGRAYTQFTQDQRVFLWWKVNQIAIAWEDSYIDGAQQVFENQKRSLLALLHVHKQRSMQYKVTVNWANVELDWTAYLGAGGIEEWKTIFEPILRGTMEEQGREWAAALGMQFDLRNLDAEDWFDNYLLQFAQPVNQTTSTQIHDLIGQALQEGWSIQTMQNNMTDIFDRWMFGNMNSSEFDWFNDRMPPHRTEMIARTETIRASNAGSMRLFDGWGVRHKEWLRTYDDRVRDTHRTAGNTYSEGGTIGAIPMNERFVVGGSHLLYPGDPAGAARETINCRCTVLPVLDDQAAAQKPPAPGTSRGMPFGDALPAARELMQDKRDEFLGAAQDKYDNFKKQSQDVRDQIDGINNRIGDFLDEMDRLYPHSNDDRLKYLYENIKPLQFERDKLDKKLKKLDTQAKGVGKKAFDELFLTDDLADVPYTTKGTGFDKGVRKERLEDGVDWLRRFLPPDTWDWGGTTGVNATTRRRSFYSDPNNAVFMGKGADTGVYVHEFAHGLERNNQHIMDRAQEFLDYRAGGDKPKWLGAPYNRSEIAYFDQFISPYMGKKYVKYKNGYAPTEIVSMGLQYLFEDPLGFAQQDPEYFDFIVALCMGWI